MASPPLTIRERPDSRSFATSVRRAVLWRSGSQVVAQVVQWGATFLVIRMLAPHDYGLFAMCQVVMAVMAMLNGYGLASALIRAENVTPRDVRQLFGMLLVLNAGLAAAQWAIAPLAAAYYRAPMVAELLRVQALLYLSTPFIALPQALLSRSMDFRLQARANIIASLASALTALAAASAGWGVWTLVAAPAALYLVRAVLLTASAKSLVPPSFDFRGAGRLARFGGVMAASQLFWIVQSQADVFIAGRTFSAHDLGLYTTALFLAQIFVAKLVPPLNEVAFSAYARIQHDDRAVAVVFVRGARAVMVAAMPFYLGLAVTAEPLVLTVLGWNWTGAVPIVRLLAIAMPFMTLQVLLTPACDARGRPGVGVGNGAIGATILAAAFLVGVRWGAQGLGWAWIAAYPCYLAISLARALPVIGASARSLAAAVWPPVLAALAMAAGVSLLAGVLPPLAPVATLTILVASGAALYLAALALVGRAALADVLLMIRGR